MAFSHCSRADISRSTFNDVGGSQNFNNWTHVGKLTQIHFSLFPPRQVTLPQNAGPSSLVAGWTRARPPSRTSSQIRALESRLDSDGIISVLHATTRRIVQIVELLLKPRAAQSPDEHRDLIFRQELDSLYKSLALTRAVIEEYKNRPLGQGLTRAISPEVVRCREAVEELYDRVSGTWYGLKQTNIGSLWRSVLWDGDELAMLRMRLSNSQESLSLLLKTLNSVMWIHLSGGSISLRALLEQTLPSLHHIPLETVPVLDHLGSNIPVPTMFCVTWKDFDYIIAGYCKDRIGGRYVERGDYQVISTEDNNRIGPMELAKQVKRGKSLELSIILRRQATFQDHKETCPRCGHINSNITTRSNGWIECRKCSGRFQVERADITRSRATEDRLEDSDNIHDEERHEEIGTPASYNTRRSDRNRPDEAQYFRRINVVCMGSSSNAPAADPWHSEAAVGTNAVDISQPPLQWRTIHPRPRKKTREAAPPPLPQLVIPPSSFDRSHEIQSWETWHPDPTFFAPSPGPSLEANLLIPDQSSPGLFPPHMPGSLMYEYDWDLNPPSGTPGSPLSPEPAPEPELGHGMLAQDRRHEIESWAAWQPDYEISYSSTPDLVPEQSSPGLFGPRMP